VHYFYAFGVAALIACLLKSLILAQVITGNRVTYTFNLVAITLIMQNLFEFLGYSLWIHNEALASIFINALVASLILTVPAFLSFLSVTSELPALNRIAATYWIFACLLLLTLPLGLLIDGWQQANYTITSIPGTLYGAFQIYSLSGTVIFIIYLIKGMKSSERGISERCRLITMAAWPIVAVAIGVNLLRVLGINASTAIVMPLASTFLIWVLMHDAKGEILPFKLKWQRVWFLLRSAANNATSKEEYKLADYSELLERQQIEALITRYDGNASQVARILGTSHSTIARKMKKYREIELLKAHQENPKNTSEIA